MFDFRYKLEKYDGQKTRFTCPSCLKKKQFTRYIDIETNEYLNEKVGVCNRENKCGYHYTPKQYFEDNRGLITKPRHFTPKQIQPKPTSYISEEILIKSLKHYNQNNFVIFLNQKFGKEITKKVVSNYKIATSKLWKGATVFWQIDCQYKIRTGKIMLYDGINRVKNRNNWVHSALQLKDFNLSQCFFGEHLINSSNFPIAIVESEKTAIIGSIYFPQYIWLASAGSGGINHDKIKTLGNRTIILFPDASINGIVFNKWKEKTKQFKNVFVNDFLEVNANNKEKLDGVDLADFLLKYSIEEFNKNIIKHVKSKQMILLEQMTEKNSVINDLVNRFNLFLEE